MAETEYMRHYMRRKRIRDGKSNTCVACGVRPVSQGHVKCDRCLDYNRNYIKQKRLEAKKSSR